MYGGKNRCSSINVRVENMTKIHGNQDTDPGDVELHKARTFCVK